MPRRKTATKTGDLFEETAPVAAGKTTKRAAPKAAKKPASKSTSKSSAKATSKTKGEKTYTASDIEVLEGLEPVRRRPGMYIGGTDMRAMHHLFAEVIDNSMDEAVAGHASFIEVEVMADNTLSNGETAAFRIEAVDSNGLAGPGFGLKLDNIGVVSVSVPKTGKE